MDPMDCPRARNLLSEYQDGTLDAAAETALAAHLRGCVECAGLAGSLLAVREMLRGVPRDPAPPELLSRVLEAVEGERRDARADSAPGKAGGARPVLSRLRIPIEAAAVVLLFASVYWYQRTSVPPALRPSSPAAQAPAAQASGPTPPAGASAGTRLAADRPAAEVRPPRGNPKSPREGAPAAPKPRAWTAADLPSVPALRASTDSERIVPDVPSGGPASEPPAAGGAESPPSRVFAAPPSRLLRPLPYGRDVVLDVDPERRAGTEERIAGAAIRLGGLVERIERGPAGGDPGAAGTVRVVLPEAAAAGFLDELRRIGTVPPEGLPPVIDIPAGPRPGTVAYAVRIRVR